VIQVACKCEVLNSIPSTAKEKKEEEEEKKEITPVQLSLSTHHSSHLSQLW
jgi:hypothetical protein